MGCLRSSSGFHPWDWESSIREGSGPVHMNPGTGRNHSVTRWVLGTLHLPAFPAWLAADEDLEPFHERTPDMLPFPVAFAPSYTTGGCYGAIAPWGVLELLGKDTKCNFLLKRPWTSARYPEIHHAFAVGRRPVKSMDSFVLQLVRSSIPTESVTRAVHHTKWIQYFHCGIMVPTQ